MAVLTYETVAPAYKVGDRVYWKERRVYGVIAECYPGCDLPLWHRGRCILHTHCYAVDMDYGARVWGMVDAELAPVDE
jgi:hypothetical protein